MMMMMMTTILMMASVVAGGGDVSIEGGIALQVEMFNNLCDVTDEG